MITLVAKFQVKEGKTETFKELCREMVKKTKEEKGCIAYDLYEDVADPRILTFIEVWEDEAALEKHKNTEHFKRIVPQLVELREGERDSRQYKLAISN